MNHLGDAPKEGTTHTRRRRPNQSPALGFPPVVETGKNEQRHDDASKKVTAPVGVAVVHIMQAFTRYLAIAIQIVFKSQTRPQSPSFMLYSH
jgi:hypothetical protein